MESIYWAANKQRLPAASSGATGMRGCFSVAYHGEAGCDAPAHKPTTLTAQSFSDSTSVQRCVGQPRRYHGQTQFPTWAIHRLLGRLLLEGECARFAS